MEMIRKSVFAPKEFRKKAVKMVLEDMLSIPEVSRRLSMSQETLAYWIKMVRNEGLPKGSPSFGEPCRGRTDNLLIKSQLLYQLS